MPDTGAVTGTKPEGAGPQGRSWRRIDGVDLLRGLSILLVLMNHVNMRLLGAKVAYTRGLPIQLVQSLVWNGQFGVQMFFVVSGYLITSTSMRRWRSPGALGIRDFYVLRFARIAPLMVLLLCLLSGLHLAHVPGYVVSRETGGLGRALLAALTFHINFLEATRGYLPGNWDILWSLSVEEMFYLLFPIVARTFRKTQFLVPVLLLFAMAGPFARAKAWNPNPVWREYSYMGGMDAIALGCLTAILLSGRRLSAVQTRVCGVVGVGLLVFSLGFSMKAYAWGLGRNGLDMSVLAMGTCLTIAAAVEGQWRAPRVLSPLLALGRYSYEVYLTHMFAVLGVFAIFVGAGRLMRGVPLLFVAVIVVAGLLGWMVSVFYTEPMNRLIRRRAGEGAETMGVER